MKDKYYVFIAGRFISSFGNWFVELALPFVIYDITKSATAVAFSFLLESIPIIILAPIISFIIDNLSRKRILQGCDCLATVVLMLCVATRCQNIFVLYLSSLILAVTNNIYNITVNAYIPDISQHFDLKFANNLDVFVRNIAMVIAPVVAGLCIQYCGQIFSFGIDAASFALSALCIGFLPNPNNDITQSKNKYNLEKRNWWYIYEFKKFKELLTSSNILKMIIFICVMFSCCGAIFSALDAVYVSEIFNGAANVYGYMNSAWGIGMLSSSAMYFLYKNIADETMFVVGMITMGLATIGYGLSRNIPVCMLFNLLGGLANTVYVIYFRTILQKQTDSKNRGKVFTLQGTLAKVISIVIVSLAGIIADLVSVRYVIVTAGVIALSLGIYSSKVLKNSAL